MPSGPSDDELGSDNPLDDTPRKKKKGSKSRKSAKGKTTKGKTRKRGGAGAAEHGDRLAAADAAMQIGGAAMGGAATSAPTTARASFDKDDEVSLGVLKSRKMAAAESKKPTHSVSLPALWVKDRSSMSGKNMTSANKVHWGEFETVAIKGNSACSDTTLLCELMNNAIGLGVFDLVPTGVKGTPKYKKDKDVWLPLTATFNGLLGNVVVRHLRKPEQWCGLVSTGPAGSPNGRPLKLKVLEMMDKMKDSDQKEATCQEKKDRCFKDDGLDDLLRSLVFAKEDADQQLDFTHEEGIKMIADKAKRGRLVQGQLNGDNDQRGKASAANRRIIGPDQYDSTDHGFGAGDDFDDSFLCQLL